MGAGAIAAAGAIGGAAISSSGAKSAAKKGAQAQDRATQAQLDQYYQTREDYLPWMEAGERALGQYEQYGAAPSRVLEGDYIPAVSPFKFGAEEFQQYQDPGYQFRLGEGERGVNRALASMGKLGSGNRLRALMELNQQMGSQEFGAARGRALQDYSANVLAPYERGVQAYGRAYGAEGDYLNRLAALSQIGQTATGQMGQFGAQASGNISNLLAAQGATQAAGQLGQTGAWSSALGDLGRQWQQYQQQQIQPVQQNYWGNTGGTMNTPSSVGGNASSLGNFNWRGLG